MTRKDLAAKKRPSKVETRASLRFDRQIIAIAKAHGARLIYSDDVSLSNTAKRFGLEVVRLEDLDLPLTSGQTRLPLDDEEGEDEA